MEQCEKVLVLGPSADPIDEESLKGYLGTLLREVRVNKLDLIERRIEQHTGDAAWTVVNRFWPDWTTVLYRGACAVLLPRSYTGIAEFLLPRMWEAYPKKPVIYYWRESGKQVYQVATINPLPLRRKRWWPWR